MFNPIQRWKAGREQRSLNRRNRAFAKAVKIVGKFDGAVMSKSVYHQALASLAVLTSAVEKAGGISPSCRRAINNGLTNVTQAFVDAAYLGNPKLQMAEVQETYVRARHRSQSRKARQRLALKAAAASFAQARGSAPSVAEMRVLKRTIKKNRSI